MLPKEDTVLLNTDGQKKIYSLLQEKHEALHLVKLNKDKLTWLNSRLTLGMQFPKDSQYVECLLQYTRRYNTSLR